MASIRIIKTLTLALLICFSLGAQTRTDSLRSAPDKNNAADSVFVMKKSPWTAVLASAVVPGLGQLYNESYWKLPIVWGATGWFLYNYIQNNNDYKSYRDQYITTKLDRYLKLREFYRDQRDEFAIYLGITYFLTLVDAYVDAHLFDFTVDEGAFGKTNRLSMRISF